jgi:hypothetical protein
MDFQNNYKNRIFGLQNQNFDELVLELYRYQSTGNNLYREYQKLLGVDYSKITDISQIPYLPVDFFKTHKVLCNNCTDDVFFESSGTTAMQKSKHYLPDQDLYKRSINQGFDIFFSKPVDYVFVFLLPVYLENKFSSLLFMTNELAVRSKYKKADYYLDNYEKLFVDIQALVKEGEKIFILGLTRALVEFFSRYQLNLKDAIIMETGGMKGQETELTRVELHEIIKKGSGVESVCSEYGMTELLSQAYSYSNGIYKTVPWMKVTTRDINDPFMPLNEGETGCLNIIDLANIYSCAFIATEDIGKTYADGSFEVTGRLDYSDLRGCNLMSV